MRKTPFRPTPEVSQTFNSGVCTVYTQRDTAVPGYKPQPELERKVFLRYEEQRVGLTRYYAARQINVDVERVIRVPQPPAPLLPTPQDLVRTDNGQVYRIDMVQSIPGIWPKSLDLTLVRFEQGKSSLPGEAEGGDGQ